MLFLPSQLIILELLKKCRIFLNSLKVTKVDSICEGKQFCVLNTTANLPPLQELHKMILRHGGTVVQNPSKLMLEADGSTVISTFRFSFRSLAKNTFVCIAATESLRVSKLKETKMCNIATVNWLMKALGANLPLKKLMKFHPGDMISYTDETASEFHRKYDIYSDSYTKNVSSDQLKSILNAMNVQVGTNILKRRALRFCCCCCFHQ